MWSKIKYIVCIILLMNKEDIGYIKKDICMTNNIDVIKVLIEEGIDINNWGICGHTPVHYHSKEGNLEIVKYLLINGSDPHKKNIYGENASITGCVKK